MQFFESNLLHAKEWVQFRKPNTAVLPTFRIPPVTARSPGQVGGERGEDIKEGPGQDDVVIGSDIERKRAHCIADSCNVCS